MAGEDDLEYRPLPDDRVEEFAATLRYAFRPEAGPFDPERWGGPTPPDRPGERRGLFDGDDLLSVCRHYFWDGSVRDRSMTIAGLSAVATPPEHRRRGLVRRLAAESLAEYRERGAPIATLWPFAHGFYARLGWAISNRYATVECPPAALSFGREAAGAGRFRQLDPDDWRGMADVLAANDADHELAIERPEEWWHDRVFHRWGDDPYVYGWERDGELRGYLAYSVEDDGDGKVLDAKEVAAADREAGHACLGFLADHDSQVERVRIYGPPDASLLDRVADPGEVEVRIRAGPMVRVVDVPAALESIAYPAEADADLVLAVGDSLADWNDGAFRLRVEDGEATVEDAADDPDAEVGIGPLSQLVVGYRTGETLAEAGELSGDEGAIDALDRLFPAREPFLRERF